MGLLWITNLQRRPERFSITTNIWIYLISEAKFIKLWDDLAHKYYNRYLNRELTFEEQRWSRIRALYKTVGIELSDFLCISFVKERGVV